MDSAPKKLDAMDKWRARVLFRDPAPPTDTWGKRMERQMSVLRVSFPFLTEKQLRGKAWTACGLRSLMGELPRSGLSPAIKKEFTKRGKDIRFTMSPKSNIKKEHNACEKNELELSKYTYKIDNFGTEVLIPPNNIVSTTPSQTPLNSLNPANLLPINETGVLSANTLKKRREQRKLKPKKVNFDTLENSSLINIVIPESSEVSWGDEVNTRMKSKYPYCSQISNENPPIIQSQFNHTYTAETISQCSTSTPSETNKNVSDLSMNLSADHHYDPKSVEQCDILQQSQCHTPCASKELQNIQKSNELFNIDSGSTFFDCNLPTAPENYWSNPMLNEEIVISGSTPVKNANIEDSTTIFKSLVNAHTSDEKSLENQIIENSATPCTKKYADSLSQDNNIDFSSNIATIDSEVTTEGSQNYNSINGLQTEFSSPLILSQNYSLPSTPQEPSINHPLLSNLCCEYSKACSKEEYKPVPYFNSNSIVRKLKEDFDKIIPPEVSLMKYFEAEEKSFAQIQSEVHEKINTIILSLEVESTYSCKKDN